jgi:hypothetical protein
MNKVKTSISINPEHLTKAAHLAKREDRSRSYILNRILDEALPVASTKGLENFAQAMHDLLLSQDAQP